jgi:hypothetical protein
MFIEQKLRDLIPFRDPKFDRCFCETCYPEGDSRCPDYMPGAKGEAEKSYLVPRGWVGIGIAIPDTIKWREWDTVYHGCPGQLAADILAHRHIGIPGDRLADGKLLRASNSADRDDLQFCTSRTVNYSSLQLYSPPTVWETDDDDEIGARATQVVLQCKQKLKPTPPARTRHMYPLPPGTVCTQDQTMRFNDHPGDAVCKYIDLHSMTSGIEILSNKPEECTPYRLLFRTFPGNPAEPPTRAFRSPVDPMPEDFDDPERHRKQGSHRGPGTKWF